MARLLLVRHGQASFGAEDYDALSPLGHEQALVLGRSLAARGIKPALVIRGTMRRHEETLSGIRTGLDSSVPLVADAGWNEFDFQHVVQVHRPAYRDHSAMMADLALADRPDRAFQQVFDAATLRWSTGGHDAEYAESFTDFRSRVATALSNVSALLAQHRDILVVSSGGPIAMAAGLITAGQHFPAALWSSFNRVTVNTGVTKVLSGRSGLSLSTFNEHTHVESDSRLLTYR